MLIEIVYNISLLLALGVVFAVLPFRENGKTQKDQITAGLVIGLVGLLIMTRPFTYGDGIVYDSRLILLSISGMFFGIVPTSIAALIIIANRILLGGPGLYAGIATAICSFAIGVLWNRFRFEKVQDVSLWKAGIEFYLIGVLVHSVMLLCMLLLPSQMIITVIETIAPSVLIINPFVNLLMAMDLLKQRISDVTVKRLKANEMQFETMFQQAPIGMSLTDLESGRIIDINQKYLDLLATTKDDIITAGWNKVLQSADKEGDKELLKKLTSGEHGPLVIEKQLVRDDGNLIWVEMSLAIVHTQQDDKQHILCMTTDISQRKVVEERVLYAHTHDSLTQLYNRSHFEQFARRVGSTRNLPLTVAFGDINGLSLINDAFGRREGDRLLRLSARLIQASLREGDYAARVGGDEFAIILPNTSAEEAEELLKGIRKSIAKEKVADSIHTSITFGFETVDENVGDVNEAIRRAENDLARRKMFDSPNIRGKAIGAIINTLHEKNKREELHSHRVSLLCERLAAALDFDELQVKEMRTLGLMHDIGKIAIPESILNKEGKLDESEWMEMRRHPEIGYRILGSVSEMAEFADYVLAHHERPDGKGYPKGLKGTRIPLQSKIIAIADAYDAMTSERPYRSTFSEQQAIEELHRCAGTQFDPYLSQVFVEKVLKGTWPSEEKSPIA